MNPWITDFLLLAISCHKSRVGARKARQCAFLRFISVVWAVEHNTGSVFFSTIILATWPRVVCACQFRSNWRGGFSFLPGGLARIKSHARRTLYLRSWPRWSFPRLLLLMARVHGMVSRQRTVKRLICSQTPSWVGYRYCTMSRVLVSELPNSLFSLKARSWPKFLSHSLWLFLMVMAVLYDKTFHEESSTSQSKSFLELKNSWFF